MEPRTEVTISSLEKEAKINERLMPELKPGSVCSGRFLMKRGYNPANQEELYKKEGEKFYLFTAVEQTAKETHSSSDPHPFYRLKDIC